MGAFKTDSIFKQGRPTYLRFSQFTKERMVPVECYGVSNPGSYLNLAWTQPSGDVSAPPKPGVEVKVHNLFNGILHIVKGEVLDVSTGSNPRIRVRVDVNCLAIRLRKHPRHHVLGRARLGQEGDINTYNQTTPHEMDVSLGGFGLTAPDKGYQAGDEMDFALELLHEDANPESEGNISCEINGRATVRRASKIGNEELVQLGLEFLDLMEESKLSLEHWLAVQDSVSRIG